MSNDIHTLDKLKFVGAPDLKWAIILPELLLPSPPFESAKSDGNNLGRFSLNEEFYRHHPAFLPLATVK